MVLSLHWGLLHWQNKWKPTAGGNGSKYWHMLCRMVNNDKSMQLLTTSIKSNYSIIKKWSTNNVRGTLINPSSLTVTEKNPKVRLTVLFSTPPPFFFPPPQSFFHHPLQMCDRLQTGWEGRTMCCDPWYCPPAQLPLPAGRGGGGAATTLLPTSLSAPFHQQHRNQSLYDTI